MSKKYRSEPDDRQKETHPMKTAIEYGIGICSLLAAGFGGANLFVQKSEYHADRAMDQERDLTRHEQVIRLYDDVRLERIDDQLSDILIIPEKKRTDLEKKRIFELETRRELLLANMKNEARP